MSDDHPFVMGPRISYPLWAGVGGVEVGDVHVGIDAPRPPERVTQLRIAAVQMCIRDSSW